MIFVKLQYSAMSVVVWMEQNSLKKNSSIRDSANVVSIVCGEHFYSKREHSLIYHSKWFEPRSIRSSSVNKLNTSFNLFINTGW